MCLHFSSKDNAFVLEQYGETSGRTRISGRKHGPRLCLCDCRLSTAVLRKGEQISLDESVLANTFGTGVPKHCLLHAPAMILAYLCKASLL